MPRKASGMLRSGAMQSRSPFQAAVRARLYEDEDGRVANEFTMSHGVGKGCQARRDAEPGGGSGKRIESAR